MTPQYWIEKVVLVQVCGFAKSRSEARRLIRQGGIRHNGVVVSEDPKWLRVVFGAAKEDGGCGRG